MFIFLILLCFMWVGETRFGWARGGVILNIISAMSSSFKIFLPYENFGHIPHIRWKYDSVISNVFG